MSLGLIGLIGLTIIINFMYMIVTTVAKMCHTAKFNAIKRLNKRNYKMKRFQRRVREDYYARYHP